MASGAGYPFLTQETCLLLLLDNEASGFEVRKRHLAASIVAACAAHPSCPSKRTQQQSSVRVVGFPQEHRLSVPQSSVLLTHGLSVSHRAAISFAPSESPRGSQAVSPLCWPVLEAPVAEAQASGGIGSGRTRWCSGGCLAWRGPGWG